MAKVGNRVKETTDTTGTGTLDLNGTPTGFRGFGDEFTSADEVYYLIVDDPDNPTSYEYGVGTFTAGSPDTLSRDTVEGSSNSGSKVSFLAGTKTVISTPTAAMLGPVADLGGWATKSDAVDVKTADYTVLAADDGKLIRGNAAADITFSLPTVVGNVGMILHFLNSNATGNVILDPSGAQTINGAATYTLEDQWSGISLWSDGSAWRGFSDILPTVQQAEAEAGTATFPRAWTAERVAQAIAALAGGGVPAGTIIDYAVAAIPAGYLPCDGANVSRSTYATLFAAIGTLWGVGDGSTTFGVPDLRRRTTVGAGGTGTATLGNAVGDTGGAETHTLTIAQMPAHTHTISPMGTAATAGAKTNTAAGAGTKTTSSTGGGTAHNNMQPSAVMRKIIKT